MNEDLSIVEYKEYNNEKDGNPYLSHTLCFRTPFLSSGKTDLNQSMKLAIEKYFSGDQSENIPDLDYKNLAMNLSKNLAMSAKKAAHSKPRYSA